MGEVTQRIVLASHGWRGVYVVLAVVTVAVMVPPAQQ